MTDLVKWYNIEPADAVKIQLPAEGIYGPLNEEGEPCPWPWEPIQMKGWSMGMYHCSYCGAMVLAGMDHIDYSGPMGPTDFETETETSSVATVFD